MQVLQLLPFIWHFQTVITYESTNKVLKAPYASDIAKFARNIRSGPHLLPRTLVDESCTDEHRLELERVFRYITFIVNEALSVLPSRGWGAEDRDTQALFAEQIYDRFYYSAEDEQQERHRTEARMAYQALLHETRGRYPAGDTPAGEVVISCLYDWLWDEFCLYEPGESNQAMIDYRAAQNNRLAVVCLFSSSSNFPRLPLCRIKTAKKHGPLMIAPWAPVPELLVSRTPYHPAAWKHIP